MSEAFPLAGPADRRPLTSLWRTRARANAPGLSEVSLAIASGALLIASFPDFNLWPLAWIGLVPLLVSIAWRPQVFRAFLLGWIAGAVFFYGSCYWLTYAMIRYGGIPPWVAYLLIVPPSLVVALFPACSSAALAYLLARRGAPALFAAPFLWVALEWARLGVTGQLWNAIGYSQAFHPQLIQSARWGGVYAVSFLILAVNAAIGYVVVRRKMRAALAAAGVVACVLAALYAGAATADSTPLDRATGGEAGADAIAIAVQPNVPMEPMRTGAQTAALIERHVTLSEAGLSRLGALPATQVREATTVEHGGEGAGSPAAVPRVVIWPESPMNFSYAQDSEFRDFVSWFAAKNHTSVLFNSLEPAPASGAYNAAVLVDEEGRLVAQYNKIRLLPFGEYVPLPRWLPGVNLIPVMVGDFTPGAEYPLIPFGRARAGVFICFESAFPSIASKLSEAGADVLVNISNDGYLGPTPVMRQHLANAVFRAVENDRPVLRVTNTGITAYIRGSGEVLDETGGFQTATRVWGVRRAGRATTFFTRHGEALTGACSVISLLILGASFARRRRPASRFDEGGLRA